MKRCLRIQILVSDILGLEFSYQHLFKTILTNISNRNINETSMLLRIHNLGRLYYMVIGLNLPEGSIANGIQNYMLFMESSRLTETLAKNSLVLTGVIEIRLLRLG